MTARTSSTRAARPAAGAAGVRRLLAGVLVLIVAGAGGPLAADLRPFVRGSWKQMRQAHQGRPLVVQFWGVTCAPCMSELPKWGELATAKTGVDIVFVAADPVPIEPRDLAAAVARTGIAPAENWMFSDSFLERLRFEVSPRWGGELPFTVMIDADGQTETTAGVMDIQRLRAWISRQTRRAPDQR